MPRPLLIPFALCATTICATMICATNSKVEAPQFAATGFVDILPSPYRAGTFLKAVDLNGDSLTDLLVISPGSSSVSVLFGDGHGKFKNRLDSDIGGIVYVGGNVAEGDFNSDGHLDLVIAMNKGPLRLMTGDGKGGFQAAPAFAPVGPSPDCPGPLFAADVNRDGKLDLVANQCQGGVGVFLGTGNGAFAPALQIPVPNLNHSVRQSMAVTDFNKDGLPDIAIATLTGVAVLLGNGDGTFREPVTIPTGCPLKFLTADVNRDGNADLIVLPVDPDLKPAPMFGSAGNSVRVYLGDGAGGFKPLPPFQALLSAFSADGGTPNHMEVADVNGDDIPDLAINKQQYSYQTDETRVALLVFIGRGDGTFAPPAEFRNAPPTRKLPEARTYPLFNFVLEDVNGDRKPDLIFLDDRSGKQLGLALNTSKTKAAGYHATGAEPGRTVMVH